MRKRCGRLKKVLVTTALAVILLLPCSVNASDEDSLEDYGSFCWRGEKSGELIKQTLRQVGGTISDDATSMELIFSINGNVTDKKGVLSPAYGSATHETSDSLMEISYTVVHKVSGPAPYYYAHIELDIDTLGGVKTVHYPDGTSATEDIVNVMPCPGTLSENDEVSRLMYD